MTSVHIGEAALILLAVSFGACGSATLRPASDGSTDSGRDVLTGQGGAGQAGNGDATGTAGRGDASGAAGAVGGSAGQGGASQTGGFSGGAGTGGVAGKALGTTCANGTTCSSGFCADGVCCDAACDRVCEQCSSAGTCQMTPDDSSCGTVDCPSDTVCSDYATSLTTNRCSARGACKTANACPFVPAASGTYCAGTSAPLFCDGAGSCDQPPTVSCGGDSACPVSPGLCCYNVSGTVPSTTCQASAAGCTASPTQCYAIQIQCDDAGDCPGGQVCCYACGLGFPNAMVSCLAPADCNPNLGLSYHLIVCSTDAECSSGQTCQAPDTTATGPLPPGYKVCRS
jgi:hypothetical protein